VGLKAVLGEAEEDEVRLISRMLELDPRRRAGLEEVLRDGYWDEVRGGVFEEVGELVRNVKDKKGN